jgi:predicted transcriptional regulator
MESEILKMNDAFENQTSTMINEDVSMKTKGDLMLELLEMIYPDDITDVSLVTRSLNLSTDELWYLINDMIDLGFLSFTSDNDVEITDMGVRFINSKNPK